MIHKVGEPSIPVGRSEKVRKQRGHNWTPLEDSILLAAYQKHRNNPKVCQAIKEDSMYCKIFEDRPANALTQRHAILKKAGRVCSSSIGEQDVPSEGDGLSAEEREPDDEDAVDNHLQGDNANEANDTCENEVTADTSENEVTTEALNNLQVDNENEVTAAAVDNLQVHNENEANDESELAVEVQQLIDSVAKTIADFAKEELRKMGLDFAKGELRKMGLELQNIVSGYADRRNDAAAQ